MENCKGCRSIIEQELSDKCKEWCKTHDSCNLRIIERSINKTGETWRK